MVKSGTPMRLAAAALFCALFSLVPWPEKKKRKENQWKKRDFSAFGLLRFFSFWPSGVCGRDPRDRKGDRMRLRPARNRRVSGRRKKKKKGGRPQTGHFRGDPRLWMAERRALRQGAGHGAGIDAQWAPECGKHGGVRVPVVGSRNQQLRLDIVGIGHCGGHHKGRSGQSRKRQAGSPWVRSGTLR